MAPFISIAYVPDTANVRQKMLFASTRNTLLRELGTEKFGESLFATRKEELTPEGFRKHDVHEAKYGIHYSPTRSMRCRGLTRVCRPAPLTEEEQTMQMVREAEYEASTGTSSRKSHVSSGIKFPVSVEAIEALSNLTSGGFITLVQLAINSEKETIELAGASSSAIGDFTKVIPDDAPRYSFFRFNRMFSLGGFFEVVVDRWLQIPGKGLRSRRLCLYILAPLRARFVRKCSTLLAVLVSLQQLKMMPLSISIRR